MKSEREEKEMSQEYAGEGWGSRTVWFKSQKIEIKESRMSSMPFGRKLRRKVKRLEESVWLFDLREQEGQRESK